MPTNLGSPSIGTSCVNVGPSLHDAGAIGPGNCSGSIRIGCDDQAGPRFSSTQVGSVCRIPTYHTRLWAITEAACQMVTPYLRSRMAFSIPCVQANQGERAVIGGQAAPAPGRWLSSPGAVLGSRMSVLDLGGRPPVPGCQYRGVSTRGWRGRFQPGVRRGRDAVGLEEGQGSVGACVGGDGR